MKGERHGGDGLVVELELFEPLLIFLLYFGVADAVEKKLDDADEFGLLAVAHFGNHHVRCVLDVDCLDDSVEFEESFHCVELELPVNLLMLSASSRAGLKMR
jgi:hypothetical protein